MPDKTFRYVVAHSIENGTGEFLHIYGINQLVEEEEEEAEA
jgi:hypothetical protein